MNLHLRIRAALAAVVISSAGCGAVPSDGRQRPERGGQAGTLVAGSGGGASGMSGGAGASESPGAGISGAASAGHGGAAGMSAPVDDGSLQAHIEDMAKLHVQIVTVQCAGDCVDVMAVAKGGNPEYHFEWEDGSTSPLRTLCPSGDEAHRVKVTDSELVDAEFGHAASTVEASVESRVIGCDGEPPPPTTPSGNDCEETPDCPAGQSCFEGICVGEGGLRFSLTWNVDTDFDLYVTTPDDITISFDNLMAGGGVLDIDDCVARRCRVRGGPHVENIFFVDPPRGTYEYWVANPGLTLADDYALEVSTAGTVQATQSGSIARFGLESMHYTFEY